MTRAVAIAFCAALLLLGGVAQARSLCDPFSVATTEEKQDAILASSGLQDFRQRLTLNPLDTLVTSCGTDWQSCRPEGISLALESNMGASATDDRRVEHCEALLHGQDDRARWLARLYPE